MTKYFFWSNWDRPNKVLYTFIFTVFIFSMISFLIIYLKGASPVIQWETEIDIEAVKTVFDNFQVGLYEFPIEVENYLILQNFVPSYLLIREWPSVLLLMLVGLSLVTLISIVSTLKRFWYIAGMALFAVALVGLKIEFLQLFGRYDKTGLFVAFFLFFSLSYYFQFFKRSTSFTTRWLAFLAAMILFGTFIFLFSEVQNPYLHLANYGLYVPIVLSILFIFIIGHEPIAAFLYVTTQGGYKSKRSNLIHFLIISLIYLINVIIVYLRNSKLVDLGVYTINSYWLLVIAAILGVWGYKRRAPTYLKMYPFRVSGAFLYISMATITFTTLSYLLLNGNDSLLETMEDAIVFSQIGHGFMFIIYVIANFYTLLYKNIQVSKIVYKPPRMPFFISRFAGLIVIMALFLRANLIPFYQSVAGYNTGIGDIYYHHNDLLAAKAYYSIANDYSATSHRTNYALACIEEKNNNPGPKLMHLLQSIIKNPTEFAYAKIARHYQLQDRFFDAMFTLRAAANKFPQSGPIANNLGLLYNNTAIADSTFFFLDEATRHGTSKEVSYSNLIAITSQNELPLNEELIKDLLIQSPHTSTTNNQMILARQYGMRFSAQSPIRFEQDMENETEQLIYNYNKLLIDPSPKDTAYWKEKNQFYKQNEDPWLEEQIETAFAFSSFSQGEISRSFNTFNFLLNLQNSRATYYGKMLGKLSLKKDAPQLAWDYLYRVYTTGDRSVAPELGLAGMAAGDHSGATAIFNDILKTKDSTYHSLARGMVEILKEENPKAVLLKAPHEMYHFIRFRYEDFDDSIMEGLVLSLNNDDYQKLAYMDILNHYLRAGDTGEASRIIYKLENTEFSNPILKTQFNNSMIRFYLATGDIGNMKDFLDQILINEVNPALLKLGKALITDFDGAREKSLIQLKQIGQSDPFVEETVLESAKQFNLNHTDIQAAYEILLNAINLNPYSKRINEAYIIQCLMMGLDNYAEEALSDYQTNVSAKTFEMFQLQYLDAKKKYAELQDRW